jgi:hypothetical protein
MKQNNFSKKIIFLFLSIFLVTNHVNAQNNNGSIDTAGDIAFVAYHDNDDGFSFIFLDDCPTSTIISFIDDEWTGSSWSGTGEGELVWQNNTGNKITKGTIIDITDADDNDSGISATLGSIYENDDEDTPNYSGFTTSTNNVDEIYAVAGRRNNTSSTFLAFIGRAGTSTLSGTGLVNGSTAHEFSGGFTSNSEGYYTGTTTFSGSLSNVASTINTSTNWTSGSFTFPTSVPNSFTGSAFATTHTWDGSTDNSWTTAANWSTNSVPSSIDIVIIPNGLTNYPTVSSSTTVNSITIASGATLVASSSLSSSSATYSRSLVNGSQWYFVSAPISGENYDNAWVSDNSIASGTGNNRGVSTFDNTSSDGTTGHWRYLQLNGSDSFNVGQGYGVIRSSSGSISFVGTSIYSASQTTTISQGASNSFNLVGNPFTAFLNLGDFFADNATVNLLNSNTTWFWNGSSYDAKLSGTDGSFEIAPGQAFFVQAGSAATSSNNLTFDINDVSHQGTDTFQKTDNSRSEINLTLSKGKNNRNARVFYIDGTTTGFDNGFDGELFGGISHSLAIYTDLIASNGKNYQVQSLPNTNFESMIIPIGIIADANETLTITADIKSLPKGLRVYLEDRANGTFTLLDNEEVFSFTTTEVLNGTGRFYLHTSSQVLSIDNNFVNNSVAIFSNNRTLHIKGLDNSKNEVSIYNLLGKQIDNKLFISPGNKTIDLTKLSTGVYIVKLENAFGFVSKRIILE